MMTFFWFLMPCRLVDRCPSSLKMETVCFSETLASAYESTQRQNPDIIIIIIIILTAVRTSNLAKV
jgi:hypothetical protein